MSNSAELHSVLIQPRSYPVISVVKVGPLWLAVVAAVSFSASIAHAQSRVVKNASVQLITGDDGKDDTDVFTITVSNAGGKFLERVFDAKEEIKPGTTFNLWLNKTRAETSDKLAGSKIVFRIDPKGSEHWVVQDARLTVNYETGPAERWHWGSFVLETKGAQPFSVEFTLSDDHRVK
jgi:hypothetical protein